MNTNRTIKICKKTKSFLDREELKKMTQDELIEKIQQLEAHNQQLKNILQKKSTTDDILIEKVNNKKRKKIDFDKIPKRHVLLKFYYLGWDYQGYVVQENTTNTIEFFLFKALQKCCLIENREKSNYHRCGRTDKGVSAFSQVISIDLKSKLSEPNENNVSEELPYCSMLNRVLPDNIRCYAWSHAPPGFSARFDCSWRTYKYYFPKSNLNLTAMLEGGKYLLGIHDFRNLCKMDVGNGVTEFVKEIKFVDIKQCDYSTEISGYQMFELIIQGKSFLWHQIRCIMSILLLIGQGKEDPEVIKHLLNVEENPSKPQYSLANHLPLNLYHVEYNNVSLQWNVNVEDIAKTIQLLQSQWTKYSVKCTMIRNIIKDLQKECSSLNNVEKQIEPLLDGVRFKVYKPLLLRMKCESLENKIDHYVKKRKLEIVDESSS